jgi:hypothetical protein
MARCLFGVFVVTAGLVVLASTARKSRSVLPEAAPADTPRLREKNSVTTSGTPRTLLRPAPVYGLAFSLN